jgi:hypothetical protein
MHRRLGDSDLLAGEFEIGMRGLLRHLQHRRARIEDTLKQLDATEKAVRDYLDHFKSDWAWRDATRLLGVFHEPPASDVPAARAIRRRRKVPRPALKST